MSVSVSVRKIKDLLRLHSVGGVSSTKHPHRLLLRIREPRRAKPNVCFVAFRKMTGTVTGAAGLGQMGFLERGTQ
jgi:hypothetical protein